MNHHPSCRPNDKSLVWHCYQCGDNESACHLENAEEKLRIAIRAFDKQLNENQFDDLSCGEGATYLEHVSLCRERMLITAKEALAKIGGNPNKP